MDIFTDLGASPYAFAAAPTGQGIGVNNDAFARQWTNPFGSLYGPGQSSGGHVQPGLPYTGLNQRDLITSSQVSPVSHDPTVNSLDGNGAYQHGNITLQDLLNVQAATGSNHGG